MVCIAMARSRPHRAASRCRVDSRARYAARAASGIADDSRTSSTVSVASVTARLKNTACSTITTTMPPTISRSRSAMRASRVWRTLVVLADSAGPDVGGRLLGLRVEIEDLPQGLVRRPLGVHHVVALQRPDVAQVPLGQLAGLVGVGGRRVVLDYLREGGDRLGAGSLGSDVACSASTRAEPSRRRPPADRRPAAGCACSRRSSEAPRTPRGTPRPSRGRALMSSGTESAARAKLSARTTSSHARRTEVGSDPVQFVLISSARVSRLGLGPDREPVDSESAGGVSVPSKSSLIVLPHCFGGSSIRSPTRALAGPSRSGGHRMRRIDRSAIR